jgi:hypothetical protein
MFEVMFDVLATLTNVILNIFGAANSKLIQNLHKWDWNSSSGVVVMVNTV